MNYFFFLTNSYKSAGWPNTQEAWGRTGHKNSTNHSCCWGKKIKTLYENAKTNSADANKLYLPSL